MKKLKKCAFIIGLILLNTSYGIGVSYIPADAEITHLTAPLRHLRSWTPTAGAIFSSDASVGINAMTEPIPNTIDDPSNRFVFSTTNLAGLSIGPVGWTVKHFTGWDPGAPYNVGQYVKQISFNNSSSRHLALQASGLAWGAYMNSDDSNNSNHPITISYGYTPNISAAAFPFDSSYGMKLALLVEADLAVTKYKGRMLDENTGAVGQLMSKLVFFDTINNKNLVFIVRLFDWRGFTIASDTGSPTYPARIGNGYFREGIFENLNGEVTLASHLGLGTLFCSMEDNSEKTQIVPWDTKRRFSFRITDSQFKMIINNANNVLVNGQTPYSYNLKKYKLKSMELMMNGARLTPAFDQNNKLEMSFIGENFKVSTLSFDDLGTAFWGDTSTVDGA